MAAIQPELWVGDCGAALAFYAVRARVGDRPAAGRLAARYFPVVSTTRNRASPDIIRS
jgi:hypothetical protein